MRGRILAVRFATVFWAGNWSQDQLRRQSLQPILAPVFGPENGHVYWDRPGQAAEVEGGRCQSEPRGKLFCGVMPTLGRADSGRPLSVHHCTLPATSRCMRATHRCTPHMHVHAAHCGAPCSCYRGTGPGRRTSRDGGAGRSGGARAGGGAARAVGSGRQRRSGGRRMSNGVRKRWNVITRRQMQSHMCHA